MRVRLKKRWGSRLQGDIISVSVERAKVLAESGIAVMLDSLPPASDAKAQAKAEAEAKAKAKGK